MTRQQMERAIAKATIKALLGAGYTISVDDGGDELALSESTSEDQILGAMFHTDCDRLIAHLGSKAAGWVFFVYGNCGWDVINDYTMSLNDVLVPVSDLSERLAS